MPVSTTAMRKMHCRAGDSDNIMANAWVLASREFVYFVAYDFPGIPIFRGLVMYVMWWDVP